MQQTDIREQILEKLKDLKNLPSFPEVVIKLNHLLEDPETTSDHIAEVIELDMSISTRILRLSNTLAYSHAGNVESISEAVMRIGFKNIRDIVLALSMIDKFPKDGLIDYKQFWQHSLGVAFAAQEMVKYAKNFKGNTENLYICGLLHEMGIMLFDQFFHDLYQGVLKKAKQSEYPLHEVEQFELGIDNSKLGAFLIEKWKLPEVVVNAVRYQYTPHTVSEENGMYAKMLHIANFACENQGLTDGIDCYLDSFNQTAWFELGMQIDDIQDIVDEVNILFEKSKAIFEVASTN